MTQTAIKRLFLLGSTGSIGRQTLEVVAWHPDRFQVVALAAGHLSDEFVAQVRAVRPMLACLTAIEKQQEWPVPEVLLLRGVEHLESIARDPGVDMLVAASSGTVGFRATLAALEAGKPVALANKETLIMAGHLVTAASRASGAALLPIDSEHSAIWQCLQGEGDPSRSVRRLLLTASGGAFRDRPVEELEHATPEQALRHPTWSMGPKITIDSATLMNKGLEVIEAHWLFGLPLDKVEVVIHHQSIIHSLVEMVDGSAKAQLGLPDMRLPIQYALAHPERLTAPSAPLDLAAIGQLTFSAVDERKYPCLKLAYQAGTAGGTSPTVLNAANEVAVARFLVGELAYGQIAPLIQDALEAHVPVGSPDLEQVDEADSWARVFARGWSAPD